MAPPATGLLASAFSFVSRELESFVTAATGGEVKSQPHEAMQPEASSSRVTLDGKGKRRERDEGKGGREKERRTKRARKRSEVESERARARRRTGRECDVVVSDDERDRVVKAMKRKMMPPPPAPRSLSSEREVADDEADELLVRPFPAAKAGKNRRDVGDDLPSPARDVATSAEGPLPEKKSTDVVDKSADPSELMPPPPTPVRPLPSPSERLMTPAPTMPGSLFPRSASLMPEPVPRNVHRAVLRLHTPAPPPEAILEGAEDESDEPRPERPELRGLSREGRASKTRDDDDTIAGPLSTQEGSGERDNSSRRSLDEPEGKEPVARPRSAKGKERACDTSGELRVRGKERELRQAREEHARTAHERDVDERERDKARIRMLEEEVARLRAELALKTSRSMMPPPPPPPPPPPRPRTSAATSAAGTGDFLASARASLKPTAPPVEAPINSAAYGGARTKRAGHPTVNVPSDKMAAFLREIKNVRLRRIGGLTGDTSMGPPSSSAAAAHGEASELSRSTSAGGMSSARMAATLGERSFDLGVATRLEIGEKRRRDLLDESANRPSKRRETVFLRSNDAGASSSTSNSQSSTSSAQSSASSSQSSASSLQSQSSASQSSVTRLSGPSSSQTSLSRTASIVEMAPPRSQLVRSRSSAPLRIWPTGSAADTDMTTPSLCSDNDNEHEHDDKLPNTPSDSGRGRSGSKSAAQAEQLPKREPEIIDVDALETPPKHQPSPVSPVEGKKDVFARRPPASPLPASSKTPIKPRPPARSAKSRIPVALPKRAPVTALRESDDDSESDNPLGSAPLHTEDRELSYAPRDDAVGPERARPRRGSSASSSVRSHSHMRAERPESRMSNHARRRLTLDEELRRAGDSLWRPSDEEKADAASAGEEDLGAEHGELVALGTKSSKRGFLARGGGAGPPVFMGEGYVQGAAAAEEGERVRSRSNTSTSESARNRGAMGDNSRRRR
ncbi:hypothetical protein BN946_scf184361.g9 [Trametes cinnabarina]|uniref:Uncharacterized protein n=1 Tax=Pycnoporus cinnabarinus TaxID=5643 RepID=A0A060SQ53_PYCCI|nr:hypothetical protein BN946_scf184361.g9 [Trametes cinnabarina]